MREIDVSADHWKLKAALDGEMNKIHNELSYVSNGLGAIYELLGDLKKLASKANTGAISLEEKSSMQDDFNAKVLKIDSIAARTNDLCKQFYDVNDIELFDGQYTSFLLSKTIAVSDAVSLGVHGLDIITFKGVTAAKIALDSAVENVGGMRCAIADATARIERCIYQDVAESDMNSFVKPEYSIKSVESHVLHGTISECGGDCEG